MPSLETETKLEKPLTMFSRHDGKQILVTHSYVGHGADDPNGYYYHYVDNPNSRHWISARAINVRFVETVPVLVTKDRRARTIEACKNAVLREFNDLGVVSVVDTERGFCVVYGNDDRLYFDTVEM